MQVTSEDRQCQVRQINSTYGASVVVISCLSTTTSTVAAFCPNLNIQDNGVLAPSAMHLTSHAYLCNLKRDRKVENK